MKAFTWMLAAVLAAGLAVCPAFAQPSGRVPEAFKGVGVDEQGGSMLPLDLAFRDEAGRPVRLGQYFDGEKPVLLNLVYHNCPMLCNLVLDGLTASLKDMSWTPGEEFEVITVSFSHLEGPDLAARQKALYLERLGKPRAAAGWHFLTGSQADIAALAAAVGFQFRWVEAQQEYAHPATLIFLSGNGKISRYLYGLEYPARHVRSALVEASEGKVGSAIDQVVLYCFQYDPNANSYVPHAINIMKLGGLLTMTLVGAMLLLFWRRESRQPDPESVDAAA